MGFKNRYKQGYACSECARQGQGVRQYPLYVRNEGKFRFAGLVNCPFHGATKAVRLDGK